MRQAFGRVCAIVALTYALALATGCSSNQQAAAPAPEASAQTAPQAMASPAGSVDASAQAQDSSDSSVAGDIWEVVTFPLRVVADIVGFIL